MNIPKWVKKNKNWNMSLAYEKGNYIVIDIFNEAKKTMRKISDYKQVKFTEALLIPGIKQSFIELCRNSNNRIIKDSSSKVITSISKKYKIPSAEIIHQLINAGVLGIQTFFSQDGVTIESELYGVTEDALIEIDSYISIIQQENNKWLQKMKSHLNILKNCVYPVKEASQIIDTLSILYEKCERLEQVELCKWLYKCSNPPGSGFHNAFEFLISVLYCIKDQLTFDWKEIGTTLDKSIGGSKRFDSDKQKLISLLETITETDSELLGLISFGSLYPLYLSGNLEWFLEKTYHSTTADTVYSLTNLQLNDINEISTNSKFVIFTENRAVLLKMQKTCWIKKTNVLVICFDGNLKIGHTKFFKKLNSVLIDKQVFVWVDGDDSGRSFAKIFDTLFESCIFIGYYNGTLEKYYSLDEWINNKEYYDKEQESVMGGTLQWDEIFKANLL